MNSVCEDIKCLLVDESSLGLVFGTDLFIAKEPSTPINTVTIFAGMSAAPMLTFIKGENYYYDAVQIRVRNASYITGDALAQDIRDTLHGIGQETVNITLYSVIYCSNGPAMLGWDDNGRAIIILNFEIQRR